MVKKSMRFGVEATKAQNSNASSHALVSSSLKNRTAKPTSKKGMGIDPIT
jgi:hypothetical protein